MVDGSTALAWENIVALDTVQALLGLLSPAMLGVAVQVDGPAVCVHFAVTHLDEALEEDIDDVVGDLEAFLWPEAPDVVKKVFIGSTGADWEGREHRLVMLAKDPGDFPPAGAERPTSRE